MAAETAALESLHNPGFGDDCFKAIFKLLAITPQSQPLVLAFKALTYLSKAKPKVGEVCAAIDEAQARLHEDKKTPED